MSAARPAASPRRQRRTCPTTVGWLAIILFCFLAGLGAITAVAAIGIYRSLATDLPDPTQLTDYVLPEQTIVYDRTGKIELARFGDAKREVVTFDEIPKVLLDATTAVEDKTFWDNAGFDPVAIISATLGSLRGDSRGASTITQQLVRERLLDPALVQDPHRTAERKLKEIIQSIRLTEAYPGRDGQAEDHHRLPQPELLRQPGLRREGRGRLVLRHRHLEDRPGPGGDHRRAAEVALELRPRAQPHREVHDGRSPRATRAPSRNGSCRPATTVVQRRNQILDLLADRRADPDVGRPVHGGAVQGRRGRAVVLSSQTTQNWIAPHFVWAVRDELTSKLCGPDADTCDAMQRGGLRVTTTLDVGLQKIAEKWVKAAAIVPHAKNPTAAAKALGFKKLEPWMANLKNKDLRNGALVALDYQTGELVAYVGSADYYATSTKPEFQPQYDVVGKGYRQPGSAFKPFNYVTAIDDKKITAGTMLMDVGTDFGNYTPNDADNLERGPVRVRNALQFSLNIPAVKTMAINGPDRVFAKAQQFGIQFQGARTAELALALGVQEVRPVDLVTAYGTLANGGKEIPHTTILAVKDANGKDAHGIPAVHAAGRHAGRQPAGRVHRHRHPGRQHEPQGQPVLGQVRGHRARAARRPATLKTGTNNDAKDLNAYGYIAPPTDAGRTAGAYALAVGVWNGNSDNSLVSTARSPLFSIDVSTYVWQGFLQEASAKWPVTDFKPPADGLVRVKIDPFTGLPRHVRQERGQRVVHRRDRAEGALAPEHVRHRRRRRGPCRDRLRAVDAGRPGLAAAGGQGPGRRRRPEPHADGLLLQRRVPPVRLELGRAGRRVVRRTESVTVVLRRADAGRERRDAVVRDPDARSGPRRPPSPARPPARPRRRRWSRRSSRRRRRPSRHRPRRRRRPPEADRSRRPSRRRRRRPNRPRTLDRPRPLRDRGGPRHRVRRRPPGGRRGPRAHGPSRRADDPRPARADHPRRRALGRARAERLGQDHPAVVHRARAVADRRDRRGPRRALRPGQFARAAPAHRVGRERHRRHRCAPT